jgi:hypothetical protein
MDERRVARIGLPRLREQQTPDLDVDAGHRCGRFADDATHVRFDVGGVLFGDHPAVELQHDLAGNDVGVRAAFDSSDVEIRVRDAQHLRRDRLVLAILRVQRVEDRDSALQRVDAGIRNRRVRHLAVHRHFELQAAVVRDDDLVAEARRENEVGSGELVLKQPAGTELAAELLVVREVQLDRAA